MPYRQVAALPWRRNGEQIQVLLATSRETRRWVIPKGWRIEGLAPQDAAAREAFEEAGLEGRIAQTPLGTYNYEKKLKDGKTVLCDVDVFALEVTRERTNWPEKEERSLCWMHQEAAAASVAEEGLAQIIRKLA